MAGVELERADSVRRDEKAISASWERCRTEHGLDQWTRYHETVIRRERVRDSIEALGPLFSACRSQVQHIFQNIVGSGHAVILTDQAGTIIDFSVQSAMGDMFRASGLRRGADWSESLEGTNGIGTAIREKKSLTVYRDQHFRSDHASMTCTGAPIFDVKGDVLALFDVSSIGRKDDPDILAHTRALLEMSARLISRRNFQDHFAGDWIIRFHQDAERVGLLEEGLLALDGDGKVIGADEQAIRHLSIDQRDDVVGICIDQLFDMDRDRLSGSLAQEGHRPASLALSDGFAAGSRDIFARLIEPKSSGLSKGLGSLQNRSDEQFGAVSKTVPTSSEMPAILRDARRQDGLRAFDKLGLTGGQKAVGADRKLKKYSTAGPAIAKNAANERENGLPHLERLVGQDVILRELAAKALKLFEHDVPLLITGETGVGKDSFARALHESSRRSGSPFITVNCGALPENLIEGELFGYKAGAFTGAQSSGFKGQILAANGGTLLLDEIGDMPLSAQTRLLQVIEQRQVTPLGSTQGIDLDIRLLAATHQSLEQLVARGRFREDLYYRICGFTLSLPALRERRDIGYLIARLLPGYDLRNPEHFNSATRSLLQNYSWPGNIRQLKHVLKTASILAEDGPIQPCHLHIQPGTTESKVTVAMQSEGNFELPVSRSALDMKGQEKRVILDHLVRFRWNVSRTASELGVSRNTLYRKMRAMGIRRED